METPFVAPWAEKVFDLINEIILSWLENFIVARLPDAGAVSVTAMLASSTSTEQLHQTISLLADAIFTGEEALNEYLKPLFLMPNQRMPENLDSDHVATMIKVFLTSRIIKRGNEGNFIAFSDNEFMAGLVRVTCYLAMEILDLATQPAINYSRDAIMPVDV